MDSHIAFSIIVFLMLFNGYIREVKKLNELSIVSMNGFGFGQLRLDIEDKSERYYYNTAEE